MVCCIIIPLYKNNPDDFEIASIRRVVTLCQNKYSIVFICGSELNVSIYEQLFPNIGFVKFYDFFFESVSAYNRLMLSPFFYKRFLDYEYILISQTDSWLFEDRIWEWCLKDYDYIGAPWINWEWSEYYSRHLTFPRRLLSRIGYKNFNMVGNGGFSLRKIKSFIRNLTFFESAAKRFVHNEDYFFSFYITSYNPFFRIPKVSEALLFSFDVKPEIAIELNNYKLPMACHAWEKNYNFWKEYIII